MCWGGGGHEPKVLTGSVPKEDITSNSRAIIAWRAWLALAAGMILGLTAPAAQADESASVPVPAGHWTLTRVLERGLHDGKAIVVTRRWEIWFSPAPTGMTVHGRQISAHVEAPAELAPIARLERERKVTDMFPARLDAAGKIIAMPAETGDGTAARAAEEALAIFRKRGETGAAIADRRRFLALISQAAAKPINQIPADLFFPRSGRSTQRRDMTLPDGTLGHIEIVRTASARSGGQLLDHSERRIVTSIDGHQQITRESWSLTPAS